MKIYSNIYDIFTKKPYLLAAVLYTTLTLFGIIWSLTYGRIGYMPQDHSAVFDGGWRILSGQIPFRDFTAPNTIVPIILQSIFFIVFGVNWFAYCLHAAVFNGLFCLIAYKFLRLLKGSLPFSFYYAMLSGISYYPAFGVPVQDQHAYFFTFLAIYLTCITVYTTRMHIKKAVWFSLPFVFAVSLLCKQIPTLFGMILVLIILFFHERNRLWTLIVWLILGVLCTLLFLTCLGFIFDINYQLVDIYFFRLPSVVGKERFAYLFSFKLIWMFKHMIVHADLFFPFFFVPLFFLTACMLIYFSPRSTERWHWVFKDLKTAMKKHLFLALLAISFIIISFLFLSLTNNQMENGIPLLVISIGLIHLFIHLSLIKCQPLWDPQKLVEIKKLRVVINIIFFGSALIFAWNFNTQVNATRSVHDFTYHKTKDQNTEKMVPSRLSFLVWGVPDSYKATPEDFSKIIHFFKSNPGNFFLVGDSSILYALTHKPSVNPVLWFHRGQTLPDKGSPFFDHYQNALMKNIYKFQVKYIVLETVIQSNGQGVTWSGIGLHDFPALQKHVKKNEISRIEYGPFTIIKLKDEANPKGYSY